MYSNYEPTIDQNEFIIKKSVRKPLQPFTLYMRTLETTGVEKNENGQKVMYEMSRLSKGTRCALQGRKNYYFYLLFFVHVVCFYYLANKTILLFF